MRGLKIAFFAFLAVYFLIVVVARTPAAWAAWVAVRSVPGLYLSGVSGTAWDGRAAGAQMQLGAQAIDLGGLQWELSGWRLLLLNACADVSSTLISGGACYKLLGGGETLDNMVVDGVPASLLNDRLGVQLSGVAGGVIQSASIDSDGQLTDLIGNLTWQGARINYGEGWLPLGSFAAELQDNGAGAVDMNVFDTEGQIGVAMQGTYTLNGEITTSGVITPREGAPAPIVNALSVFAEPTPEGGYQLSWPMGG